MLHIFYTVALSTELPLRIARLSELSMVAGAGIEPTSPGMKVQKKLAVSVPVVHILYVALPLSYPAILNFGREG